MQFPYKCEQVPIWGVIVLVLVSWVLVGALAALVFRDRRDMALAAVVWLQATMTALFLTQLLKVSVGRPRPNFANNPVRRVFMSGCVTLIAIG